jgi:hypothetical protein
VPILSTASIRTVAPSAMFSIGGRGVFLVSATGFRHCNSTAYLRKSSFESGLSVKSSPRHAAWVSLVERYEVLLVVALGCNKVELE